MQKTGTSEDGVIAIVWIAVLCRIQQMGMEMLLGVESVAVGGFSAPARSITGRRTEAADCDALGPRAAFKQLVR
eukprot:3651741-Alexandrium_andersonii.AAC.1